MQMKYSSDPLKYTHTMCNRTVVQFRNTRGKIVRRSFSDRKDAVKYLKDKHKYKPRMKNKPAPEKTQQKKQLRIKKKPAPEKTQQKKQLQPEKKESMHFHILGQHSRFHTLGGFHTSGFQMLGLLIRRACA